MDSYADPDGDDDPEYLDETHRRRTLDLWSEGLLELPDVSPDESPTTVWELIRYACDTYQDSNCFGTREYLGKTVPEDGGFPKAIFGETEWTDYATAGEQMEAFGAGLRAIGLQPTPPGLNLETSTGPHTMLVYEDTCQEWMTSVIGAHSQSIVVATSYATLGIQAVVEAMKECNTAAVVCNRKSVAEIQSVAPGCLKTVIYTNHNVEPSEASRPLSSSGRCRVISYEELLAVGEQNRARFPPTPPTPEMLAVIMYTSGSTGKPKGVMIPHRCVTASASALQDVLSVKPGEETHCAYLPAAHIMEFCTEVSMLFMGAEIGFADPKTISSKGACRMLEDGTLNEDPVYPNPPGGIQEFRPTFLIAVPVVWDTFKKGIEEKLAGGSCVIRWLFQVGYSAAYYARKQGRSCPLFNAVVFKSIKSMVGGRMKFGVSGGGPISQDVQEFMSVVACMPLIQGYALTETCCAGTIMDLNDPDPYQVGGAVPSVELKLRSCDGAEDPVDRDGWQYLATDDEHLGEPCLGRGEVCIRGPSVSLGYFKQPDKTREAWDGPPAGNGWFRSGDIAYWDKRGRLHIVDRLKNLVKLKGGEYIAVENMEKEYACSVYVRSGVSGGVMCYGDGTMRRPGALVQANMPELRKWASGAGLSNLSDEELCRDPKAEKAVCDDLNRTAGSKLSKNESLVCVKLIPGTGPDSGTPTETSPWDPANGCRTASNKLERRNIQKSFPSLMEALKKAGA